MTYPTVVVAVLGLGLAAPTVRAQPTVLVNALPAAAAAAGATGSH